MRVLPTLAIAVSLMGCLAAEPELPVQVVVEGDFPTRTVRDHGMDHDEQGGTDWPVPPLVVAKGNDTWHANTTVLTFEHSFGKVRFWRPYTHGPIAYTITLAHSSCKGTVSSNHTSTHFQGRAEGLLVHGGLKLFVHTYAPCKANFSMKPGAIW